MESKLTKAQHYRNLAVHMRKLAADEADAAARKSLIELSETYDRLCEKRLQKVESSKIAP